MALNIPNTAPPLEALMQGINTGGTLYSRIMQPILHREQQKQAEEHFKQQMALRKAQFARSGQNQDLQRAIMQQQLTGLMHRNDPMYEMNQYKMLEDMIKRGQGGGVGQPPMPRQPMGEGLGAFNPEALQGAQQSSQSAGGAAHGGIDMDLLRSHPVLRGFAKKHFGIDVGAQTPGEKEQHAVSQATSIAEAKSNIKKLDEIEKTAQSLLPYLGKVNTIEDILHRKPELAGRTTQLADFLGMTKDTDVGEFLSAAQALQAHMAKEMSSRGGYGVSKLVEQAKPNLGKSSAYNTGVVRELKRGMKESFDQMKSEYERLSGGKKFPYNFEQYFKQQTGGASTSGSGEKRLKYNRATGRLE